MQNIFFISFEKGWTFLLFLQVMDTYSTSKLWGSNDYIRILARADIADIWGHTINPQSLLSPLMFDELFPKKKHQYII